MKTLQKLVSRKKKCLGVHPKNLFKLKINAIQLLPKKQ